jgi:hypothetical protein
LELLSPFLFIKEAVFDKINVFQNASLVEVMVARSFDPFDLLRLPNRIQAHLANLYLAKANGAIALL